MKISEQWLREWVNPAIDSEALVRQLSMAGLEVDGVEPAAPAFNDVVVARVVSVTPHPDADKLHVCQVDDGDGLHDVVCGAPNVRADMLAPYARIGAVLPDGTKIRKAKLRGVESRGMLCGADELGLLDTVDGLLELGPAHTPGTDLRAALGLDDVLIDIDLTPNRGDCLSLRGLAREVSVLNDCEMHAPVIAPVAAQSDMSFPVAVQDPAGCPRYLGRVIRNVDVSRESPWWLRERLRRCGIRPIDAVVDVTNFVLLELGQPMHAFDLDRLQDRIVVRRAQAGEQMVLLDGVTVTLDEETLLIADGSGPVAMAGVMGGAHSGIVAEGAEPTRNIFLECAFFSPETIAGRARRFGLHTDASHRYERGVDFELQAQAMERATQLLLDIVGGEPGPVTEAVASEALPERRSVTLRQERLNALLGMAIEPATVTMILQRLGLPVLSSEDRPEGRLWRVQAPSWRFDIEREADLIEEVARVYGYDNISVSVPVGAMHLRPARVRELTADALRDALAGAGFQEILSYSFVEPELNLQFCPNAEPLQLANPISAELAVMRGSLWPGLVKTWMANRNRQQTLAHLFEVGRVFERVTNNIVETEWVAGLLAGARQPEGWAQESAEVDFFDARGAVEVILQQTRRFPAFRIEPAEHPALHPGQSAAVETLLGERIGWVGRLHPRIQRELDLPRPVYLFELAMDGLRERAIPCHQGLSRFPSVRRDVAVELDTAVPASSVLQSARAAAGEWLVDLRLFDVYAGEKMAPGRRSLALAMTLQHPERTLAEAEVTAQVDAVVSALERDLRAVRR